MKRPKRENCQKLQKLANNNNNCVENGTHSVEVARQHIASQHSIHGSESPLQQAMSDVLAKKVPKTTNGTVRRRQRSSQRDSTTSSSGSPSASSCASSIRRPIDVPPQLHQTVPPLLMNSSTTMSSCATPATSTNDFHLHPQPQQPQDYSATPLLLNQLIASPLMNSPSTPFPLGSLNYGPFGLPQMSGIQNPASASVASLQQFGTNLVAQPNLFEGLPIFVVPQAGNLSLDALRRATEFKAMALSTMLQQQQQQQQQNVKVDTSKHFHVFVGDLSQEVDNQMLKEAGQKFGEVSEAKVMRDPQSAKSRSFGFVAFPCKEDAQRAIEGMNGIVLGKRPVRTGWAVRRGSQAQGGGTQQQQNGSEDECQQQQQPLTASFESIYNATDADNTTIYLGGLPNTATEEPIRSAFGQFGVVKEIRLFASQNFGFVAFSDKASAARAILEMHGRELNLGIVAGNCTVRVKWGRQPQQNNNGGASSNSNNGGGGATTMTMPTVNIKSGSTTTIPALVALSQQQQLATVAARLAQQQQQQQQLAALSALCQQQHQAPITASFNNANHAHPVAQQPLISNYQQQMPFIANLKQNGIVGTAFPWAQQMNE